MSNSSTSDNNGKVGVVLDDAAARNIGLDLPERTPQEFQACVSGARKYSPLIAAILMQFKDKIEKAKKERVRVCMGIRILENGQVMGGLVPYTAIVDGIPEMKSDARLMKYIEKYDMEISIPVALRSMGPQNRDYFASVIAVPWLGQEILEEKLRQAMGDGQG